MLIPKFTMVLDKENPDIIKFKATEHWKGKEESEEQSALVYQKIKEIVFVDPTKKFKYFGDMRATEKDESIYLKERINYIKILRLPSIRKMCMISNSSFVTEIAKLLWTLAGKDSRQIKFFKNEKEAWNWIVKD